MSTCPLRPQTPWSPEAKSTERPRTPHNKNCTLHASLWIYYQRHERGIRIGVVVWILMMNGRNDEGEKNKAKE